MLELLWIVPALPLASFVVLALFGARLSRRAAAWLGAGSVGLAAALSFGIAGSFITSPPPGSSFTQVLWQWWSVGGLAPAISLHLDPLSVVMLLVVTGIGFLIHLYATEYMADDEGFARFFAYLNLFVAAMLFLVLAEDLLLLYLGWEGVGMCSYLLIGFWYREPKNGAAARKAFIVTRVGDVALALGLFLLFTRLGTLEIPELLRRAAETWQVGDPLAITAAALILGGAVGKSAQLPLQVWLPDAMAGPTPVSALIHAATMVTAGVYLIARVHPLFELAPPVLAAVAIVGAATLLMAACSALFQNDLKRVLAYSTISQLGYMFLALGVGAWSAAVFHLLTHACFKALLFLGAGTVITAQHHEQDIRRMGGLRHALPGTFWCFLIGAAALAGLPLVTAGFYSKDLILHQAWVGHGGSPWLWGAGLLGAFLTALYISRTVLLVFFGEQKHPVSHPPGLRMHAPLVILAALSLLTGFLEMPQTLGGVHALSRFLSPVFPMAEEHGGAGLEILLQVIAGAVALLGIFAAWRWLGKGHPPEGALAAFWHEGWGFDRLYAMLFVRPFVTLGRLNHADVIDKLWHGLGDAIAAGHRLALRTQTGRLRTYAAALAAGGVLLLALVIALS